MSKLNFTREELIGMRAVGGFDVLTATLIDDLIALHEDAESTARQMVDMSWRLNPESMGR